MEIITRFAPSPTGFLHVGNARTALNNWLFTRKFKGKFILRIDDTDLERSKKEYEESIKEDLLWLGLEWDETFHQSERIERYNEIKEYLISIGKLYPCYETAEELEAKRKLQLSRNLPPIYDRAALNVSAEQKEKYSRERKPHFRFFIEDAPIKWDDMIKGEIHFEGRNISDPILVREDGSMTYILCSVIDDIDYKISHIIRGEDHISNTALMKQIFDALGASMPKCAHRALVKSAEEKISKRLGGFEVKSLREKGIEPMAINSFFAKLGSNQPIEIRKNIEALIDEFDIDSFSQSPANYDYEELERLNHKLLNITEYEEALSRLKEIGINDISKDFWEAVRSNINSYREAKDWLEICSGKELFLQEQDKDYLQIAAKLLPAEINEDSWSKWTNLIASETAKKGKELFMPLRIALTGKENGPELKKILPLIGRTEILRRLGA